jgi:hypothetical protein
VIELGRWYDFRFRGTRTFLREWHRHELHCLVERLALAISWHVPRWLVNWCVVRAAVLAAGDHRCPTDLTYSDLFKATQ